MGKSFKDKGQKFPKFINKRLEDDEEFDWKEHVRRTTEEEKVFKKQQEELEKIKKTLEEQEDENYKELLENKPME